MITGTLTRVSKDNKQKSLITNYGHIHTVHPLKIEEDPPSEGEDFCLTQTYYYAAKVYSETVTYCICKQPHSKKVIRLTEDVAHHWRTSLILVLLILFLSLSLFLFNYFHVVLLYEFH